MRKATTTTPARKPRSTSVQRSTGFFGPARGPGFFTPVLRKSADVRAMQTAPTVSRPGNALERQADRVADQVIRMPGAPTTPARRDDAPPVQRLAEGPPADAAGLQSTTEGRHLLAHELTHTIQQGATVARAVRPEPAAPTVQRLGLSDALDWFAGKAAMIPGFRMLTLVIGFNPINGRSVDRTAGNFLRALIELVPGGSLITQALDNHGVINSAASWVERKVAALGDIGAAIVAGLNRFIDSLGVTDILSPGDVWDRAKRIVTDPVSRLIDFGSGVVGELLDLVKQAILRPLAALAASTRGYDLLKAILGRDPITGAPYPRTAETLIGGFMKLIGQDEVWENLKRGKAVQRAYAWFQGALTELLGFVRAVPARIVETLRSLTFPDVVSIVGAFRKVGSAFLGIAGEFGSWAGRQVLSLLEILVSVVAPGVMPYIAKARTAFHTIVKDPVRFVGHLVRAGRLGFQRFADNILEHLKTSLIRWLVGPLAEAGVYIPKSFSLLEIVKLMVSVLGLTWQNIRAKLLRIIPEPVLQGLEKTAAVLVTLATDGPAAAWEQIKAELSELKDQLVGQVTQMIRTEIVKAAVTKLVTMLNPAGAVVQAIVAIWNTVSFFVEKIQQIGAVVAAFVDSIAAIAAGQVEPAAKRVEQTMANTLTLVIGFLAKFAGLGGIPVKLVGVVRAIRAPVDRALDKIVAWLGALLQKIVGAAKEFFSIKERFTVAGEEHDLYTAAADSPALTVASGNPTNLGSHPDKAVRDAHTGYVDAVTAADVTDSARKDGRRREAKKAAAIHLPKILTALRAFFASTKSTDPQASAPGLGNVAPYRDQPSSLHKEDVPLWMMINEHVIPRAWIDRIFRLFRMRGIRGGSSDYRNQHTVKIYKGAAGGKTDPPGGDNDLTAALGTEFLPEYEKSMQDKTGTFSGRALAAAWNSIFSEVLPKWTSDAAKRTYDKVLEEGKQTTGGKTNRDRRAPAGKTEDLTFLQARIDQAVVAQVNDIKKQRDDRL